MKKLLFASMAVAMLAACSNDEVVQVSNDSNAIKFGVNAENSTRAADIYCNSNPFGQFNVYATYDGAMYIDNDLIVKNGSSWENNSGLRYWPESGDVTFYGYVNGSLDVTETTAPKFETFSPAEDVAQQLDLMYARKTQAKSGGEQVTLNFRHALSQIVFNARNENDNLYVEIGGVSVVNVKGSGVYSLPTEDTDGNLDHEYGEDTYKENGRGSWDFGTAEATSRYSVAFTTVELNGGETKNLTNWSDHTSEADKGNAMLLLPQPTEKYDVSTASTVQDENGDFIREGSYFLVDCKIWNVAGSSVNKDTDVVLWDKGNVMIPVGFDWEEGKKYLYTFVFGNGNGGYDPDPEDPTPDPVLVPITFDVTIDEFYEVDGGDQETGV